MENKMKEFVPGNMKYTVSRTSTAEEVCPLTGGLSQWSGGYLAFSNKEGLLAKLSGMDLEQLLKGKFRKGDIKGLPEAEGYLMEVGLWREAGDKVEEICVEREDAGFIMQRLELEKLDKDGTDSNCYYRPADTLPRPHTIFRGLKMKSYEVIQHDMRLHFFLIVGGEN